MSCAIHNEEFVHENIMTCDVMFQRLPL